MGIPFSTGHFMESFWYAILKYPYELSNDHYSGCHKLAEIEENIVLLFSEGGGSDDVRLKTLLHKGYWV